MDEFETNNKALSVENEGLKARIAALESQVLDQHEEIKRLSARSEEQMKSDKRLEEHLEKLEENGELDDDVQQLNLHSSDKARVVSRIRRQASHELPVAFFATLTFNITSTDAHQAIPFNRQMINVGNAYNSLDGQFRAPVSGIYVFSTTLLVGQSQYSYHFQIQLSGGVVSNLFIINGQSFTQDAVLHLNQGDKVSIHNMDAGYELIGARHSSFSGLMLRADSTDVGVVGK